MTVSESVDEYSKEYATRSVGVKNSKNVYQDTYYYSPSYEDNDNLSAWKDVIQGKEAG